MTPGASRANGTTGAAPGDPLVCVALAAAAALLIAGWIATVDYRRVPEAITELRRSPAAPWLLAYPAVLVLALFRRRRSAGALAVLVGAAGIGFVAVNPRAREMFLVALGLYGQILAVPLFGLLFSHLVLITGGAALRRHRPLAAGRALSFVLGALVAVSALSVGRNVWLYRGSSPYRAKAIAAERVEGVDALRRMNRCLTAYAAAQNGRYPARLQEVGPQGSGCLDAAAAEGSITGYTLSYTPVPEGTSGRFTDYSVTLVPVDPQRRVYDSYRTDESGVLYSGLHPDGKWGTPIQNELMWIQTIENCAEQYRLMQPARSYPTRAQLLSTSCMGWGGSVRSEFDGLRAGVLDGYRYVYTEAAPDEAGKIASFRLDVRPVVYGRGFKTSYLCDPQGRLRVTDEDRPAEHTDRNLEKDESLDEERPYHCIGQRRAP